MREIRKTIRDLKKEIDKAEITPELWFNLGCAYFCNTNFKKAISAFCKSLVCKPNLKETYFNLGLSYLYSNDYQKSLEAFKKCLEIDPTNEIVEAQIKFIEDELIYISRTVNKLSIPELNFFDTFSGLKSSVQDLLKLAKFPKESKLK